MYLLLKRCCQGITSREQKTNSRCGQAALYAEKVRASDFFTVTVQQPLLKVQATMSILSKHSWEGWSSVKGIRICTEGQQRFLLKVKGFHYIQGRAYELDAAMECTKNHTLGKIASTGSKVVACNCNPSLGRQGQEDHWGSLASQSTLEDPWGLLARQSS